jgi:hypothetical protein
MLIDLLNGLISGPMNKKGLVINKILKNRYNEITAAIIKSLSVEDLEAAIISYIVIKGHGTLGKDFWLGKIQAHNIDTPLKSNKLPMVYQMYFAMLQIEMYLDFFIRINKLKNAPIEEKDGFTVLFKNFMEREKGNLIPLAINGYELFKRQDVSTLLKELSENFSKKKVETLSQMLINSNVEKINFIKHNPGQFITSKDFINKNGVTVQISTPQDGKGGRLLLLTVG